MKRAILIAVPAAALLAAAGADEAIQLKLGSAVPPASWPNTRGPIPWTTEAPDGAEVLAAYRAELVKAAKEVIR